MAWLLLLATAGPAVVCGGTLYPAEISAAEALPHERTLDAALVEDGTTRLTIVVVDGATGDTLHARCNVVDCYNAAHFPLPGTSFIYFSRGGYFYTRGVFSVDVPCGYTVIRIGHGPEYGQFSTGMVVGETDTTVVLSLDRIADMRSEGWISGDCHVHINHEGGQYGLVPANALTMGKAEDLQIVNCLDNVYFFTGAADPCSDDECIIYMSEEFRSDIYGHLGLLGLGSTVFPVWSRWWPMTTDIADSVLLQDGAITVSAHPVSSDDFFDWSDWPENGIARALPVDVIEGRIDAFEVMSYSNYHSGRELDLWYRILNCGFSLPACGGTDACMNRWNTEPLGGIRTYVYMPGGEFSVHAWSAGLSAGRTFVTNGPLITGFEIDGSAPGDTVCLSGSDQLLDGSIAVTCAYPLDRVEIVKNGGVAEVFPFSGDGYSIDTTFSLFVDESCWVAARVYGENGQWYPVGDSLFAHSSPIYIQRYGMPALIKQDAVYMSSWIDDLISLIEDDGDFVDPLDSLTVMARLESARQFYLNLAYPTSPAEREGDPTPRSPVLAQNTPNPFNATTSLRFTLPEGAAESNGGRIDVTLSVYDVSGRLVRTIVSGELPPGSYHYFWDGTCDGGRRAASGVYFSRLTTPGSTQSVKMILLR